jgi:hypothetical protein
MYALVALLDVVILSGIYVAIARDEMTKDKTATPEMWRRSISWYQKKETATRDGVAAPRDRRIGHTRPTTNNTHVAPR